jgi:hypothetical protein
MGVEASTSRKPINPFQFGISGILENWIPIGMNGAARMDGLLRSSAWNE